MAQQVSHDFLLPNPRTIKVDGQNIQVYDAQSLGRIIRNIKAGLDSLSGRGTGNTQVTGPLTMNTNKIMGLTNSAAPTDDEAVSYGLAQAQYTAVRPTVTNINASYTILSTDGHVRVDASHGALTTKLPAASTVLGKIFTVKKIDSSPNNGIVTVSNDPITGAPDSIDGQASYPLTAVSKYLTVRAVQTGTKTYGYDIVANN